MRLQYIGVTGFTNPYEVKGVGAIVPARCAGKPRWMAGVLMNSRTLHGLPYTHRYPDRLVTRELFSSHGNALNFIHYHSVSQDDLLLELLAMVGMYWKPRHDEAREPNGTLDGFQLNLVWPDPGVLRTLQELTGTIRNLRIILQVDGIAFDQVANSPSRLATRLGDYRNCVDLVFLDLSCGAGKPMDVGLTRECLRACRDAEPRLGLGIAGGLSADNLAQIRPIIEEFPDVSIDAEGRLRREDDTLDIEKTKAYLAAAFRMYS